MPSYWPTASSTRTSAQAAGFSPLPGDHSGVRAPDHDLEQFALMKMIVFSWPAEAPPPAALARYVPLIAGVSFILTIPPQV
jgi:hypothetical protein